MSNIMSLADKYWERHKHFDGDAPTADEFFDVDEYIWIQSLADFWDGEYDPEDESDVFLARRTALAEAILDDDPQEFERILELDTGWNYRAYAAKSFARLVLLGLEYGVACGNGACANYLGALYYTGNVVDQDYARAKELYETAEHKGIERAIINLGYIYEYGRCGEPDYLQAYLRYAKVAALTGNSEALYKMGDMYSRAKVVERDLNTAFHLYDRSLGAAGDDIAAQAQPAIRLAKLVSDPANKEWGIPYDPMAALSLYQLAERGLRIDIAHGQTYYKKRLQEAIDGQARMREILDDPDFVL